METMTDKDLDMLFEQSARRGQIVEQINAEVMKTVRRDMRLKVLRKWARLLGISFGLPAAVSAYILLLKQGLPLLPEHYLWVTFIVPVATLFALIGKFLHDFSVSDL